MQIKLETTEVKIEKIAYHRNGVSGEPFFVINFTCIQVGEMVGIVFTKYNEEHDKFFLDMNPRVAVFEREKLGDGIIEFGENSYRGDHYSYYLLDAINQYHQIPFTQRELKNIERERNG